MFSSCSGVARFHQTCEASLVTSPAVTALANSAKSASGSSPVSQRTQHGSARPNRTGGSLTDPPLVFASEIVDLVGRFVSCAGPRSR